MKKLTQIVKDQYKSFKDEINVNNSNREDNVKTEDVDSRGEDMSCECNIIKEFETVLKDISNHGKTTKSMFLKVVAAILIYIHL